ncbi:hypothetical protein E2F50_10955 [Rhizobium deserti]|uniref:Uncharacterized protein n=1 Tax=Rhizobium deserti TaxID=2547961 RepID=A0A4R5UKS0_9HYPH|nr:hypothetical protein [Rhizobium deserti]TDK37379.1 hypothetical protein E2F50_10955 [Rhizobium deserti]
MVDPITPIFATSPSSATKIGSSVSITSEAENAWVAARQSHITADLDALKDAAEREDDEGEDRQRDADDPPVSPDDRHPHSRFEGTAAEDAGTIEEHPLFSGESERIGTQNFDENTPFGERVAII